MLEAQLEQKCCSYAKSQDWFVTKFVSPNNAGVPDRILIKDGRVVFVEFKRKGEKPRKLQEFTISLMRQHGADVAVVDNFSDFKEMLECTNVKNFTSTN